MTDSTSINRHSTTYKNYYRVNNERILQDKESKCSISFIHIGKSTGTIAATMIHKACSTTKTYQSV